MRHREVLVGLVFGLGASLIDVVMHARMSARSVLEEIFQPDFPMIFYRVLFLVFGLAIGVLLWQKNKRERDFRRLAVFIQKLRHEVAGPSVIIHTQVQLMLTREQVITSAHLQDPLRAIYEQSKKLQALIKEETD